ATSNEHLVISYDDTRIYTTDLHQVAEFKTGYLFNLHATPVTFDRDMPPYFAIIGLWGYQGGLLAGFAAVHTLLQIYDHTGQLVYDEVIGERCESLAAIPDAGGTEKLLVGGDGKVLTYRAKQRSGTHQPPLSVKTEIPRIPFE